jgi:hypothetical protein
MTRRIAESLRSIHKVGSRQHSPLRGRVTLPCRIGCSSLAVAASTRFVDGSGEGDRYPEPALPTRFEDARRAATTACARSLVRPSPTRGAEACSQGTPTNASADLPAVTTRVIVRPLWNDWRTAECDITAVTEPHWARFSAEGGAPAPRPLLHGFVFCDCLDGDIGHECDPDRAPHRLKVCILKKDNLPAAHHALAELAGLVPQP